MRTSLPVALFLVLLLFFQPALLAAAGQQRSNRPPGMNQSQRVAHVLSRLTFGARPGDFERVKAAGVDEFIRQQLDPDSLDDVALQARLKKLPTLGMATPVIFEQYTPPKPTPSPSPNPTKPADNTTPQKLVAQNSNSAAMGAEMQPPAKMDTSVSESQKPESMKSSEAMPKPTPAPKNPQMVVTELQRAAVLRAVYSERQLYEVMVDFWENHFNVFANKDADRYLLTSFDRDTIRPFAFDRFRDLLGATAHSPAMLFYLDNWRSSVARPYPATKEKPAGVDGGINENYARELMELHTMGVDGGYTQKDVQEVARCFTGWTIQKPNEEGLFLYRPGLHDNGEKLVLGHKIAAGGGIADGERVLDILAKHPATARFIATKLARRFIRDDPPQLVIDRAAKVFLQTDGSIRETLRAIITAPEFFSPAAYRAKVRTPLEYVAAAMRALNAETDADAQVLGWIARMGQPVFGRITPDGYPDRSEQWLSAGALLARLNFASALATNGIKGTRMDPARLLANEDANNTGIVSDRLIWLLLAGDVSARTRDAMKPIASGDPATSGAPSPELKGINYSGQPATKKDPSSFPPQVAQLITLLIGSPEFQRR